MLKLTRTHKIVVGLLVVVLGVSAFYIDDPWNKVAGVASTLLAAGGLFYK